MPYTENQIKEKLEKELDATYVTMSNEKLYVNGNLCSILTFAVIVRWAVSLHPYSGQNTPPLFGDYEAQRHWMEITVNLPLKEWYFNTTDNDLKYWGLDYPPLSAYHSYINGKIAEYVEPAFVELHKSRGYESYNHKFFMRATVVAADLVVYFTSVVVFFNNMYQKSQKCAEIKHGEMTDKPKQTIKTFNASVSYLAQIAITLLYPGLILIDHGHFQYNSISLGFTISGVAALIKDRLLLSSFFFSLAINYKQMSLYHSLPFFVFMLSHCCQSKKSFMFNLRKLFSISLTVIFTFTLIWFPFSDQDVSIQVIKRLFPLQRGIFEDKVSNVWCAVNVFYKLNTKLSHVQMAKFCTGCVLMSSFASLANLFLKPTIVRMLLSLINVSLSFFLFSYQVHEKSILLVATPVLLFFPIDPFPCFWFLFISNFSMLPLYLKDNLLIPFLCLSVLFFLFVLANVDFHFTWGQKPSRSRRNMSRALDFLFVTSIVGCALLFLCSVLIPPPPRYPDLWPLLSSIYSCFHFCLFFLYFNYVQIFKTLD